MLDFTYNFSLGTTYNGEGQMTSAAGVNYTGACPERSRGNGDGKRVSKSSGKLYWYGMGSSALDESDASGNITNEYVFFGGKRIARRDSSGNVSYYFADHLGTSRVVTNSAGTVLDDSDFYPFGGERAITSSSGNTYKFTGKERDTESGLDYFGARYYPYPVGRFLSPDPVAISLAHFGNPQRWNQYTYSLNNPVVNIDIDGRFSTSDHDAITFAALHKVFDDGYGGVTSSIQDKRQTIGKASKGVDHSISGQLGMSHQADHFLRYGSQGQHAAYRAGVNHIRGLATTAFHDYKKGIFSTKSQKAFGEHTGQAVHTIQDSYAHTTRNAQGQITHVACFTCVGSTHDHHDPAARDANGNFTAQAQGAVDATAAFIQFMYGSVSMTDAEFAQALGEYLEQYFGWAGPDDEDDESQPGDSGMGGMGIPPSHPMLRQ